MGSTRDKAGVRVTQRGGQLRMLHHSHGLISTVARVSHQQQAAYRIHEPKLSRVTPRCSPKLSILTEDDRGRHGHPQKPPGGGERSGARWNETGPPKGCLEKILIWDPALTPGASFGEPLRHE